MVIAGRRRRGPSSTGSPTEQLPDLFPSAYFAVQVATWLLQLLSRQLSQLSAVPVGEHSLAQSVARHALATRNAPASDDESPFWQPQAQSAPCPEHVLAQVIASSQVPEPPGTHG